LLTVQAIAQTFRSDIRPILLDVFQAFGAWRLAENYTPASGNIAENRPQAVLFLVIYQDEEINRVVIERISCPHGNYPITCPAILQVQTADEKADLAVASRDGRLAESGLASRRLPCVAPSLEGSQQEKVGYPM